MLTWKVWSDQELLFEGPEDKARQYLIEHVSDHPELVLESPDGDLCWYADDRWMPQVIPGLFWWPNGAYT